jgi:hypothetical protein
VTGSKVVAFWLCNDPFRFAMAGEANARRFGNTFKMAQRGSS